MSRPRTWLMRGSLEHGEWWSRVKGPLPRDEMLYNLQLWWWYAKDNLNWKPAMIAAAAASFVGESGGNPNRWEGEQIGNLDVGYGLVQWTPASKYIDWCKERNLIASSIWNQFARIKWEYENGFQWNKDFASFLTDLPDAYNQGGYNATNKLNWEWWSRVYYPFDPDSAFWEEYWVRDCNKAWVYGYERPADPAGAAAGRYEWAHLCYGWWTGAWETPITRPGPGAWEIRYPSQGSQIYQLLPIGRQRNKRRRIIQL